MATKQIFLFLCIAVIFSLTKCSNGEVHPAIEELKTHNFPPSFMKSVCNLKSSYDISRDSACISWFRKVTDHCAVMLDSHGLLQRAFEMLFYPDEPSDLQFSTDIDPESLSPMACRLLFVNMAQSYVAREPLFALVVYQLRSLYYTIWIMAFIVSTACLAIPSYRAFKKCRQFYKEMRTEYILFKQQCILVTNALEEYSLAPEIMEDEKDAVIQQSLEDHAAQVYHDEFSESFRNPMTTKQACYDEFVKSSKNPMMAEQVYYDEFPKSSRDPMTAKLVNYDQFVKSSKNPMMAEQVYYDNFPKSPGDPITAVAAEYNVFNAPNYDPEKLLQREMVAEILEYVLNQSLRTTINTKEIGEFLIFVPSNLKHKFSDKRNTIEIL